MTALSLVLVPLLGALALYLGNVRARATTVLIVTAICFGRFAAMSVVSRTLETLC